MTQPRYAETINLNHFDTTRIYRINQRQYPSVTSIIGMMDKPALVPWAAKMAAEYAANHLELLNQLDIEDRILLIKNNWRKQLTRAADFGTAVHKMIEEGTYPDPTERAFSYCLAAERMLTDWELTVDTQEITLVNPAAGYAGTVDVTAYNPTAELFYLDWKTGKGSYIDSHGMQLSALMEATHYIDQEGTLHKLNHTPSQGIAVRLGEGTYHTAGIIKGSDTHQALYAAFIGLIDTWNLKKLNPEWDTT